MVHVSSKIHLDKNQQRPFRIRDCNFENYFDYVFILIRFQFFDRSIKKIKRCTLR